MARASTHFSSVPANIAGFCLACRDAEGVSDGLPETLLLSPKRVTEW